MERERRVKESTEKREETKEEVEKWVEGGRKGVKGRKV